MASTSQSVADAMLLVDHHPASGNIDRLVRGMRLQAPPYPGVVGRSYLYLVSSANLAVEKRPWLAAGVGHGIAISLS